MHGKQGYLAKKIKILKKYEKIKQKVYDIPRQSACIISLWKKKENRKRGVSWWVLKSRFLWHSSFDPMAKELWIWNSRARIWSLIYLIVKINK